MPSIKASSIAPTAALPAMARGPLLATLDSKEYHAQKGQIFQCRTLTMIAPAVPPEMIEFQGSSFCLM